MKSARQKTLGYSSALHCLLGLLLCGMLVSTPQTLRWLTGATANATNATAPAPVEEEEVKHAATTVMCEGSCLAAVKDDVQHPVKDDDRPSASPAQVAVPPPKAA